MEELNDLNYNAYLARAIEIFNEKMDADFSLYNVILSCCLLYTSDAADEL